MLGILVNYVLGIGLMAFVFAVALWRRRYLDDKVERAVLGTLPAAFPGNERRIEQNSSGADGGPIRVMILVTLLMTGLVVAGMVIAIAAGSAFSWIPVGCLLLVWIGVALTALGNYFGRRSR